MTSKLFQFTFEGSGRTIAIEPVSPIIIQDLRRKYPQPQPPLIDAPRPGGSVVKVADETDVGYLRLLADWQSLLESKIRRAYIAIGVKHRLTTEEKAEVDAFRTVMADADPDMEIDKNDLVVFVQYICIKTSADYTAFVQAATGGPQVPKSNSSSTNGTSEQEGSTSDSTLLAVQTSSIPKTSSIDSQL